MIPYADEPWNEIIPGLYMGGHEYHEDGSVDLRHAKVTPEHPFTVVYSIRLRDDRLANEAAVYNYGPPEGTEHHLLFMPDAMLNNHQRELLRVAADRIVGNLRAGDTVLVRCRAGYNRSGLLVALVMLRRGWTWTEAVAHIKRRRSPYALGNEHFRRYLAREEQTLADEQERKADELAEHVAWVDGGDDDVRVVAFVPAPDDGDHNAW